MEAVAKRGNVKDFFEERNGIYEPDAEPYSGNETAETPSAVNISFAKEKRKSGAFNFVVLCIVSLIAAVCGAVFLNTEKASGNVTEFLNVHINGDFFANASATFIASVLWCTAVFLLGFFAFAKPLAAALPIAYSVGVGISFRSFIELYGFGGVQAFAAFCLVRVVLVMALLCYVSVNSFEASSRLRAAIRGSGDISGIAVCFKKHTVKFLFSAICAFLISILDAACGVIFGNYFII